MERKKRNIILAVSLTAGGIIFILLAVFIFIVAWALLHTNKNAVVSALNQEVYTSADCLYYDRLMECVDSHSFDFVDKGSPSNYLYGATPRYISNMSIYISENASGKDLEEVNELLQECCDICVWQDEQEPQHSPMEVRATIYYFNESEMYYTTIVVNASTDKSDIDVGKKVGAAIDNDWRKAKEIPTEVDTVGKHDDCLIIVY